MVAAEFAAAQEPAPLNEARRICSWVTISGQLNTSSEWYPGLPPERLDLLQRTMPSHGLPARPVDLFENPIPRVWLLSDTRRMPGRAVLGLLNWETEDRQFDSKLQVAAASRHNRQAGCLPHAVAKGAQ
jgi:hypothetical protein